MAFDPSKPVLWSLVRVDRNAKLGEAVRAGQRAVINQIVGTINPSVAALADPSSR